MYKFKLKEIEVGDTDTKGGKKSTVTDINPETGAITWDIKDVADFSSTYKELEKAKDFLSKLEKTGKSKDDPAIDKLAAEIQELFNTFRTHIRKNYPEEYKRVLRLKESVNESVNYRDMAVKSANAWDGGEFLKYINDLNKKNVKIPKKYMKDLLDTIKYANKHKDEKGSDYHQTEAINDFYDTLEILFKNGILTGKELNESVNEGKVDWDNIAKEVADKLKGGYWPWAIKKGVENITPEDIGSVLIAGGYTTNSGIKQNIGGIMDKVLALVKESVNEGKETFDWNDLLDALGEMPNSGKIQKKINQTDPEVKELLQKEYDRYSDFSKAIASMYNLNESVNEQSEQWTQLDVININKSLRLALKTFNNLVRNLERLEGELGKHSNKPQGNLLQGMAPDSFDYMGVQNKLNKLYNAFSNAFSNVLNEDKKWSSYEQRMVNQIKAAQKEGRGMYTLPMKTQDFYRKHKDKFDESVNEDALQGPETKDVYKVGDTIIYRDGNVAKSGTIEHRSQDRSINSLKYYIKSDSDGKGYFVKHDDVVGINLEEESSTSQGGASFTPGSGAQYATPYAFKKKNKSNKSNSIYKYKLSSPFNKPVPKKIKGSGLEVKQLFEKEELTEYSDFQQKRINVFDEVEERLNSLGPLLSNAKNATAEYYNENPGAYTIIYSTDMINELLDDIKELLKQTE